MPDDDLSVSYSVRELVAELRSELRAQRQFMEERFDRMERSFQHLADGKADKAEVAALALKVEALEEDKRTRDQQQARDRERRRSGIEWRRWAVPVLIAIAELTVMTVQLLR